MEFLWLLGGIIALLLIHSIVITLTNTKRDELIIENKQMEERLKATEIKLKESEDRYDKLYKGEIPKEKEEWYEAKIAQLKSDLTAITEKYNTLKGDYERNIGYPVFDGTKKPRRRSHSDTVPTPSILSESEHSIIPDFEDAFATPEVETFEEYTTQKYADVLMENVKLKSLLEAEKGNNLSSSPLILRFQVDDYVKSIENDSIKRIEQSDFGIEESFFKNLSASTMIDDGDQGKKALPALIHIDAATSSLFSFNLYSKQKNDSWKKYRTSLSSCSCEAWNFAKKNPKTGNKIPCKHMTFLAQHLGIFDINNMATKQ